MSANGTQKNLIKHLIRAPRYAFIEAHKNAENASEREHIERVAETLGVRVEWARIYAHGAKIRPTATLDEMYDLFKGLTDTEKEIYFNHIIKELYHE